MSDAYNRIAAGDVGRIAALSDGVFAIAMTLLVLEIHAPESADIHGEAELVAALAALAPRWLSWALSAMTLGIFWVGQQTQLNQIERADRDFTWANYLFLVAITALPFSTRLLADFFEFRTAIVVYWANILLCGVTLYLTWSVAARKRLVRADCPAETGRAIRRRIVIAQSLYLLGGLIGLVHSLAGVVFIIAVQLNYAVAPIRSWARSAGDGGEAGGD